MAWTEVVGIKNGTLSLFGGFRWQVNSQDIALNKSNITIQMYAGRSTSGSDIWNLNTQISYIEFDGRNRQNISSRYDFRNATINVKYYVGTDVAVFPIGDVYTFDVTHNADGTRTLPIKTFFNGNNSPYLLDITTIATITLPTIARASQPRLDAPSKDFGQTLTIYTDKASPAFTHTITYAFGIATGTIATGAVDSTTWVVPTSLGSQIPTSISGSGTITCDTYNGTTLIGTKTVAFTLTVPASWRAVMTTAHSVFSWVNNPAALTGYVIQNISALTLTLAAALNSLVSAYGTTITGYQVRFDTYNSGEVSYANVAVSKAAGVVTVSGVQYAYYKVKDARGYWSNEVQEQIMGTGSTIYPYGAPANNGFNVARNSATPTTTDYQMNFGRSAVNGANTWNYQRQYWNGSAWVNVDASVVSIPADTIISTLTHSLPYVEATVYQVRVKLSDLFNTIYYEDTLPTSAVPFVITDKGAGAGKIATNAVYDFEVGSRGISSDGPINGTAANALKLNGYDVSSIINTDGNYILNDTRGVDTPTDIGEKGVRFDFKGNAIDGLFDGGSYHGVMTLQQWDDASGGSIHQLGMTDNNGLWIRTAPIGGTWGTWSKVVTKSADGYIYNGFYNTNVTPQNELAATSYIFEYNNDGFMRKKSLASVKAELLATPTFTGVVKLSVVQKIVPINLVIPSNNTAYQDIACSIPVPIYTACIVEMKLGGIQQGVGSFGVYKKWHISRENGAITCTVITQDFWGSTNQTSHIIHSLTADSASFYVKSANISGCVYLGTFEVNGSFGA